MNRKRRAAQQSPPAPELTTGEATADQVRALLHELQVHSEEVTVQNEQLLRVQHELEEARDRYADLFDFAPIGYLLLDRHGVIREINICATTLLERNRAFLLGLPLLNLIAAHHRERIRGMLLSQAVAQGSSVEIDLRTPTPRTIRLVTKPVHGRGEDKLFSAMLDITAEKQLEAETAAAYQREQRKSEQLTREVEVRIAAEERVKGLLERLVSVQEEERRRLALNLHDQLGQQLTALRLALSSLRDGPASERANRFATIDQIVTQLDRDVDLLAWQLRPPMLDDVGLDAAITDFLHQWSSVNRVVADFHHAPDDGGRLGADIESNLYRVVQEALNNISKHAHANHVSVILERRGAEATLIVEDDGRGFELADELVRGPKKGMGLAGMRERTALMGGDFEIESTPGKGTTLFLRIPVSPPSSANSQQNS